MAISLSDITGKDDEDESFLAKTGEFLVHGLSASALSAGISLANTGIALGNSLGADVEQIDTEESLRSLGFDSTAEYYSEHTTALDTIGFIAGSLVPGMAGVKALRAAQTSVKTSARLSTGLKRALVPDSAVGTIRKSLAEDGVNAATTTLKDKTLSLIREGFHQQALEAAAFEGAVLLTLNQSSALNTTSVDGEDLGYFDAISANIPAALFGLTFGTAIGGTFAATKLIGGMKKELGQADLMSKANRFVATQGEKTGMGNGDAFLSPLNSFIENRAKRESDNFASLSKGEQNDLVRQGKVATTAMEKIIAKMTYGDAELSQQMLDFFQSGKVATLNIGADYSSGVKSFRRIKDSDHVFDEQVGTIDFVGEDEIVGFLRGIDKESGGRLSAGGKFLTESTDDEILKASTKSKGSFTFPSGNLNVEGVQGIVRGDIPIDPENIFTYRRAVGRNRTDFFSSELVGSSVLGSKLKMQSKELSKIARVKEWKDVDSINMKIANNEEISKVDQQLLNTMNSSEALLADSYAMLSDPVRYKEMRKVAPDVFKLMYKNQSIQRHLAGGKQILRIIDGELMEKSALPTAADLGEMKLSHGIVHYGENHAQLGMKFDANIDSLIDEGVAISDVNAIYATSKVRDDIIPGMEIDFTDIPKLTAAYAQGIDVRVVKKVLGEDGVTLSEDAISKFGSLENTLLEAKVEVGLGILKREQAKFAKKGFSTEAEGGLSFAEIGQLIDTGEEFVKKLTLYPQARKEGFDIINSQYMSKDFDIPFWSVRDEVDNFKPYYSKVVPDRNAIEKNELGAFRSAGELESLERIQQQRYQIDQVTDGYFGELASSLEPSSYKSGFNAANNVASVDNTSGLFTSANADFLTGSSTFQNIGAVARRVETKVNTELDTFMAPSATLATQSEEAAYEYAALSSTIRQTTSDNGYIFIPDTLGEFVQKKVVGNIPEDKLDEVTALLDKNLGVVKQSGILGVVFPEGVENIAKGELEYSNRIWTESMHDDFGKLLTEEWESNEQLLDAISVFRERLDKTVHQIKTPEVNNFLRDLSQYNDTSIVPHVNSLGATVGAGSKLREGVLYLGPIDTKKFKFHALVVPTGKGTYSHKDIGMLVGSSPADLQHKMDRATAAFGEGVNIHTNKDIESYKKFLSEYESDKLFRKNHMESDLARRGIFWDVTPEPDPNAFVDTLNNYKKRQVKLTRSMMEAKYSEEIGSLRQYSDEFDRLNSPTGSSKPIRNAYSDNINLMLNKRPDDPGSLWNEFNTITEDKVSEAFFKLRGSILPGKETGDWQKMNQYLEDYGLDKVYSEANELFLLNVNAPRPVLQELTSKMNAALGTLMLRMDSTQAVVNSVSLPVSMVSVFQDLKKMVSEDTWRVMSNGATVKIPGVDTDGVASLAPMMFEATKRFSSRPDLMELYTGKGFIRTVMQDIKAAEESFSRLALEKDPTLLGAGLDKVIETLSIPVDFSEQFVKFIAADVGNQLTTALKIPEHMKWSTVNTFVSRVHGNYVASQRPTAFQGWAGQAIGLFQTYQFNLMQNIFKNVANGNNSIARNMILVQGGIFGAQSLPGFQLLNRYVGERSQENNDFYKATNELLGDDMSNAILYGLASSATVPVLGNGIDLYSRGDLTPRTPILLPTSVDEIPMYSMTKNFVSSVTGAVSKMQNGAPVVDSMVNALAHNGLNRPLQGVFQLMEGYRTTGQGAALFQYQAWDAWNITTKLMGTKTLDEAVAASSFYRNIAYASNRQEEINEVGEAFRQTVRSGGYDSDEYLGFQKRYMETGGKKENFDRWVVRNMSNATESQIKKLRDDNNSVEGRYLQEVIGGEAEDVIGGF